MAKSFAECGVPAEVFCTVCYHFDGQPGSAVTSRLVSIDDTPNAYGAVTRKYTDEDDGNETFVAYVWTPKSGLRHVQTRVSGCRGGFYAAACHANNVITPSDEVMAKIVDWWHAQACTYETVG